MSEIDEPVLLINIGNTSVQMGTLQQNSIRTRRIFPDDVGELPAVWKELDPETSPERAVIASVNDDTEERIREIIKTNWKVSVMRFQFDLPCPIDVVPSGLVGDDRLLNAVASWEQYRRTVLIVDCGTAVTIDVVQDGRFEGGTIAPGLQTSARALHRETKKLPLIDPEPVDEVIGRDTETALSSGLRHGFRGMVRSLLAKIREELEEDPVILGTGGLVQHTDLIHDLVDHTDPRLTLKGLRIVSELDQQ